MPFPFDEIHVDPALLAATTRKQSNLKATAGVAVTVLFVPVLLGRTS